MISDYEKVKLIARFACPRTNAAELRRCAEAARGNWVELSALADENHVSAAVAKKLAAGGLLDTLPDNLRDSYRRIPLETAAFNMLLSYAADEILDAAAANNIDVLPVKGIALLGRVCPPDERQLSDIDFFFRLPQLAELEKMMAGLGYKKNESCLPAGFAGELSGEIKFTAVRAGALISAEFHWDPSPAPVLKKAFSFDEVTLWNLCVSHGGRFSLSPEGEFLYHIYHLAVRHSCSRLQWFLDLDRMAAYTPPDWDSLLSHLRSARLTEAARYVFRFMDRFLETPLPVPVQQLIKGGGIYPGITDRLIVASIAGNRTVKQSWVVPVLVSGSRTDFLLNYIFPPADFLRRRYPGVPVPLLYFYRPLDIAAKILRGKTK
jgi:hypothetical protein